MNLKKGAYYKLSLSWHKLPYPLFECCAIDWFIYKIGKVNVSSISIVLKVAFFIFTLLKRAALKPLFTIYCFSINFFKPS